MHRIWYKQHARHWDEALPLGNGRMGAMVFGRAEEEIIQLNEESLWSGKKIDRWNKDSFSYLPRIRKLIEQGKINEAEQLAVHSLSGTPQSQRCYQTLGELRIFHHYLPEEVNNYTRELDLGCAIASMGYSSETGGFHQEVFISKPADCMVVVMEGRGKQVLNFHCRLEREKYYDTAFAENEFTIGYEGNTGGMKFTGMLTTAGCDGAVSTLGEHLVIKNAHKVTLMFAAATSFHEKDPKDKVQKILANAGKKTTVELRQEHLKDYQRLFRRVTLELKEEEELEHLPTDVRLGLLREGKADLGLLSLYFHYGRYLMIASSREGGLPANLQGLWNPEFAPPWDSKYTININMQMNYWPVDICHLEECFEPFFIHLRRIWKNGTETAKRMYGCRGFVAHHNTDIYGDTEPQDQYIPATYWVLGGAWLALHIWEHYEFTRDLEFLSEYYDILKDAVLFFQDFLIKDEEGYLVTSPSVSPENTYIMKNGNKGCLCAGPTMDCEILYDLFHDFLKASKELGVDSESVRRAGRMLPFIPRPQVGRYGQIVEWRKDYDEAEPGHRHISQLFGVFPSAQINFEDTPDLMIAAENTLKRRLSYGGGHTGWSRAWIILLWARLRNGEKAYDNLRKLIERSTFDNLMDNHPYHNERGRVFQIDGNFGAITGIAEMLVQSQNHCIHILPALPAEWKEGCASGLCVRGHGEVEIRWKDGNLTMLGVKMQHAGEYQFCYRGVRTSLNVERGVMYILNEQMQIIKIACQ